MPLVPAKIKKTVEDAVFKEYKKQFGKLAKDNPKAEESWHQQAKIASVVAEEVIKALLSSSTITVATTGTAAAQTGTGKLT